LASPGSSEPGDVSFGGEKNRKNTHMADECGAEKYKRRFIAFFGRFNKENVFSENNFVFLTQKT